MTVETCSFTTAAVALYYPGLQKVILQKDVKMGNVINDTTKVDKRNEVTICNVARENLVGQLRKPSSSVLLDDFITKISCKSCKKILLEKVKAIPLPSTGWMDLLDCWSCHQDEFAVVTGNLVHGVEVNSCSLTSSGSTNSFILPPKGCIFYQYNSIIVLKDNFSSCSCFKGKYLKDVKSSFKETHLEIHRSFIVFDEDINGVDCFALLIMDILEALSVHNQRVFEIGRYLISIISKDLLVFDGKEWCNSALLKIEKSDKDGDDFVTSWTKEMHSIFMERVLLGMEVALKFYPHDSTIGEFLSLIQIN